MKLRVRRPRRRTVLQVGIAGLAMGLSSVALADNPIVQTNYTADPAPMVYEGRLYVYTTHDEDVTVNGFFTMNDWRLYSTVDMVNWTDHGSPLSYKSFSWGQGDAWAGQCIPRGGKFYFYVPMNNCCGTKIGVAVADNPIGPYKDALGKALIGTGSGNIDPTVYIDDDGQAYLYWGNPDLMYVKLNSDMISFPGSPTKVNLTTAGFGTRSKTDRATAYEEGPWFYKRGSLYYMIYPADGTPEKISYSTSSAALGPWTYRGDIMAKQSGTGSSFTNHPGIVDFKGKSYFFYHNGALPGGGGYKRSVCVEEFTYGADGSIPTIKMSTTGPAPVATLDPYVQQEAETIAFSAGLKTETCSEGGIDVTQIHNGDYIKVRNVSFGTSSPTTFEARVASSTSGGTIEIRLDSQSGTLIGSCAVSGTGGNQTWTTKSCTVSGATGTHDLFFKFTGSGSGALFNFNWWKFSGGSRPDAGAPDAQPDTTAATGGQTARTGGTVASGGTTATGGATSSGGQVGTGGSIGTGGTSRTGGQSVATGGTNSSGGSTATGGTVNRTGGVATGGASATGGIQNTGGTTSPSSGGVAAGTGGSATGGSRNGTGGTTTPADNGCSCRVGGSRFGAGSASLVMLVLGAAWINRRRRRG